MKVISFPGESVEALYQGSFSNLNRDPEDPTIIESIAKAEIIDGMAFVSIGHVLYFKKKMARAKDLADIRLIEEYIAGENR